MFCINHGPGHEQTDPDFLYENEKTLKNARKGPGDSVGKKINLSRSLLQKYLSYVPGPESDMLSSVMTFVMTLYVLSSFISNLLLIAQLFYNYLL